MGRRMGRGVTVAAKVVVASAIFAVTGHSFAAVSFQGLGDLPGGTYTSVANGLSDDGTVVVGYSASANGTDEAFRWTAAGGMQPLGSLIASPFFTRAQSISGDGTTIVGRSRIQNSGTGTAQYNAFRWTAGGGMVSIGELPGGTVVSTAYATSGDGSVIVGSSGTSNGTETMRWTAGTGMQSFPGQLPASTFDALAQDVTRNGTVVVGASRSNNVSFYEAWRWTSANGLEGLGKLPGGRSESWAHAVSDNGNVVVGHSGSSNTTDQQFGEEAFRWTPTGGMVGLGDLPGGDFYSDAFDVSADGSIIVGSSFTASGSEAFIWDPVNHMRRVRDILDAAGLDLTGWQLSSASAITGDGRTIVGTGTNPDGNNEAWIATVPEPAGTAMVLLAVVAWQSRARRRTLKCLEPDEAGPR